MQLHESWSATEEEISFYWNLIFISVVTRAFNSLLSSARRSQLT